MLIICQTEHSEWNSTQGKLVAVVVFSEEDNLKYKNIHNLTNRVDCKSV